jgi:PleD family two-component response regulator
MRTPKIKIEKVPLVVALKVLAEETKKKRERERTRRKSSEIRPKTAKAKVGLLIADDADVFRKAILSSLEDEPSIQILGEATSFEQAMSLAGLLKPDVILLDVHMKDTGVYESTFIRSRLATSGSKVLAMSLLGDDEREGRILADAYGAVAMLDKADLYTTLMPAILKHSPANSLAS